MNLHEAKVCYSATYDAGNNSETAHTNKLVASNYRRGFPSSIRIQPNCHRNWHHQTIVTGVLINPGVNALAASRTTFAPYSNRLSTSLVNSNKYWNTTTFSTTPTC